MERKNNTKKIVADAILRENEDSSTIDDGTDTEMPDDTDGLDPEAEKQQWELREMRRIKRFVRAFFKYRVYKFKLILSF